MTTWLLVGSLAGGAVLLVVVYFTGVSAGKTKVKERQANDVLQEHSKRAEARTKSAERARAREADARADADRVADLPVAGLRVVSPPETDDAEGDTSPNPGVGDSS